MTDLARPEPIRNLIVVSDPHVGCQMGLMHPDGARLDASNIVKPNRLQLQTWEWWRSFWDEWVPRVTRGEAFDVCINGDLMDGRHHNATTQWSQSLSDQSTHAELLLRPIVDVCKRLYVVRGTEAHSGPAGEEEEKLAKALGAVPNEDGNYARFELWKRVGGPGGPLCHLLHHIGVTGRAHYESSAPQAELMAEMTESGRAGEAAPDYSIRSHRHRFIKTLNPSKRHECAAIVTPGWQWKTPFIYKTAGGRVTEPQFGGILIRQGDEEFYSRHWCRSASRPRVEEG